MTLQWALDAWQSVTSHGAWIVLAPVCTLISYEVAACVRNFQQHRTTRMLVQKAPAGTTVTSTIRRAGGVVSELVVEVGERATAQPSDADSPNETGT
ncbi:hypothetical protein GCM10027088_06100 [Nocardia goodfellowii]